MDREKHRQIETILPEGTIFEMILTTVDGKGRPNAAPVGATRLGQSIYVNLEEDTQSLRNIDGGSNALLNLVQDPIIFAKAAFNEIGHEDFVRSNFSPVPAIRDAAAIIVLHPTSRKYHVRKDELGSTAFVRIAFEWSEAKILGNPRPHSRRFGAAIEAMIAVTRAEVAARRGIGRLLPGFRRAVELHASTAKGNGEERLDEVFEMCLRRIDSLLEGGEEAE